jgi:hypothetical protein
VAIAEITSGIRDLLGQYHKRYRNPELNPLKISNVYYLHPEIDKVPRETEEQWPNRWPYSDKPGVYLIFGLHMRLLYVGKTSMNNTIGSRLGDYFQYTKDGTKRCQKKHSGWVEEPMYVAIIPVDDEAAFEAAAIEEYLIKKLQPINNEKGKKLKNAT